MIFDLAICFVRFQNFSLLLLLLPKLLHDSLFLLEDPFLRPSARNGVVLRIHQHVTRDQRELLPNQPILLLLDKPIIGMPLRNGAEFRFPEQLPEVLPLVEPHATREWHGVLSKFAVHWFQFSKEQYSAFDSFLKRSRKTRLDELHGRRKPVMA